MYQPAHQEQLGVQCLDQGQYDMQIRGIKLATFHNKHWLYPRATVAQGRNQTEAALQAAITPCIWKLDVNSLREAEVKMCLCKQPILTPNTSNTGHWPYVSKFDARYTSSITS